MVPVVLQKGSAGRSKGFAEIPALLEQRPHRAGLSGLLS